MARIDAFLKLGSRRVARHPSRSRRAADAPHARRPDADQFREVGDAELEGYITEILNQSRSAASGRARPRLLYVSGEGGRFSRQVYRKETGIGATFRSIPSDIPASDRLGLPPIIKKLCDYHQGMVLVTADRHRQVDDARLHDRPPEHLAAGEHHQPRDPIEFVHKSRTRR